MSREEFDEETKPINLLSFDGCILDECDCGCNFKLGMRRKEFVKLWKLIQANFEIKKTGKNNIKQYLHFSKNKGDKNDRS